jgi:uncharacterized protein (UPF0335 family)
MTSDSVAKDLIKAFVERILRLREEAKAINGDIREVYAEAKGNGFDKTVLGKLVSYVEKRATGAADLQEAEALFDLYLSAYDGATGTPVATHTHEEEFDPETGEISSQHQSRESTGAVPTKVAADANAGGENVAAPISETIVILENDDDGESRDGGLASISAVEPGAPTNVVTLHRQAYNPATHFENSKGLLRLHGCNKPEVCGSANPRVKLCFSCSVKHDGPSPMGGVA